MYTKCRAELQKAMKDLFHGQDLDLSQSSAAKLLQRKELFKETLRKVLSALNPSLDRRTFPDNKTWRKKLYDKQEGLCAICKQALDAHRIADGEYAHLDHRIPHSKGGKSNFENAQLVHADCNLEKGARGGGSRD